MSPITSSHPPAVAAEPPADLSAALLGLIIESRGARTESALQQMEHANELVDWARRQIADALARADAADERAGFWGDVKDVLGGDVATIAGVVASAAVVVGTGGVGAAAIVTLAATGLTVGATVGERAGLDPKACAILGCAGAALGVAAGNLTAAQGAFGTLATVAYGVEAGATAGSGAARMAEGHYEARSLDAQADQQGARHVEDDAWLRMDLAVEDLEQAAREIRRSREAASSIQRTSNETNTSVLCRIGAV